MLFKAGKSYPPFFLSVDDLGTLTWLVDTEPLTHLNLFYSYPWLLQNLLQYPTFAFTHLLILWSDNGIFLFMIHYTPYFCMLLGEIPIWFGTTLSVATVISLNKTQFITHSRVFSLWSSFPFRLLLPYVIFKLIL